MDNSSNPFRNSNNQRLLRGLFYEETKEDKSTVVYTLKREDHAGYPSLYRLYMETADPTEYKFASQYLDGWSHWEQLVNSSWFSPYAAEWRRELDVSLRSKALAAIIAVSEDTTNNNSYHANKYLLDGSWKPVQPSKRGRPRGDEVKEEIKLQAASLREIEEDRKRLGLN